MMTVSVMAVSKMSRLYKMQMFMSILACKLILAAKVLILFDIAPHFSFIKNATVIASLASLF